MIMTDKIKVHEWFDPYNVDHVHAYHHLQQTGSWPEGFIPEDMNIHVHFGWPVFIAEKLATAYVNRVLDDEAAYDIP